MVADAQQPHDSIAQARRATLEQFATLPTATQTAFLQRTYAQPELRSNPGLLHDAMQATVEHHLQGQHTLELAALLQLSPQLAPTGREHEQQTALKNLAAVTHGVQADVKQAIARGETVEHIKTKAASADQVTQAVVATEVQRKVEVDQQQRVADNDATHRQQVGLAQPAAAAEAHPMAHLVPEHLKAAIGAAFGGAQQAQDAHVAMATGGKQAPEANKGRG